MLYLRRKVGDRIDGRHEGSGDTFMVWLEDIHEREDGELEATLAIADSLHNFTFERHDRRPKPDAAKESA